MCAALRFCRHAHISKDLRQKLDARFSIARPEIVSEQISVDGTRKWLMRFPPRGAGRPVEVETVYIPEEGRGTLCISSRSAARSPAPSATPAPRSWCAT
jgi:23S rRNA (adenine2503-C2)-methyltransferase